MEAATGVGVVLNPAVSEVLSAFPEVVDYVEVIPETCWTDLGRGASARYEPVAAAVDELESIADRYPLAIHAIGLSIGSATPLDEDHVGQLRRFADANCVSRISEHLGFFRVAGHAAHDRHVGMGFPIPCDEALVEWLSWRIARTMNLLGQQLILENGVRHTPYVDQDMSEPEFLNLLADGTGCGVLLDLHNLYVDQRNNGESPYDYIDQLDLRFVREIHIAGGSVVGRAYTDSHAGPVPHEVWDLLDYAAPQCPNLEGITYEFHDSYFAQLGVDGVVEQLARARKAWRQLERATDRDRCVA